MPRGLAGAPIIRNFWKNCFLPQVSRMLTQYLSTEEYAEYDHFLKMKAKLVMDKRQVEEDLLLAEEQLQALLSHECKNQRL